MSCGRHGGILGRSSATSPATETPTRSWQQGFLLRPTYAPQPPWHPTTPADGFGPCSSVAGHMCCARTCLAGFRSIANPHSSELHRPQGKSPSFQRPSSPSPENDHSFCSPHPPRSELHRPRRTFPRCRCPSSPSPKNNHFGCSPQPAFDPARRSGRRPWPSRAAAEQPLPAHRSRPFLPIGSGAPEPVSFSHGSKGKSMRSAVGSGAPEPVSFSHVRSNGQCPTLSQQRHLRASLRLPVSAVTRMRMMMRIIRVMAVDCSGYGSLALHRDSESGCGHRDPVTVWTQAVP